MVAECPQQGILHLQMGCPKNHKNVNYCQASLMYDPTVLEGIPLLLDNVLGRCKENEVNEIRCK